jgi:hypothetical protein
MRIFLSWSGERSRRVALALREWLPLVLHYTQPWMSDLDIAAGQRWGEQIETGLSTSEFGILCCTKDNLTAPWLLFEAGALAHALARETVCPLALDIEFADLSGPLAQFQAKKCDGGGLLDLVRAINHRATEPVPEHRLYDLHLALWGKLYKELQAISASADERPQSRPDSEILEQVLAAVQNLGRQIQLLTEQRLLRGEASLQAPDAPGHMEELG